MATAKLTKTLVDQSEPGAKEYEIRDTITPGFLLKVLPSGRKVFMLAYRTNAGVRRKPSLGRFGELTVEQARDIAKDWLADIRRGDDPSAAKKELRGAMTIAELCDRFIADHCADHNKPSSIKRNQSIINCHLKPKIGSIKVPELERADVLKLMAGMKATPVSANRMLAALRKMLNLAELWGERPDGSNPCRHVRKYPEKGKTRYITDDEMIRLYSYLDAAESGGLEHPFLLLGIRLQFEFAARMSEITSLKWAWIDLPNRRVTWPDSKTGDISKPLSDEALRLLTTAPRLENSPFVCPAIFDPMMPMSEHTYSSGWKRILKRAGVPHVGTHGIRHRAATDIANSGVPVKVGMVLTAHKTVTMFMRYVHTEDDPVRTAADTVSHQRASLLSRPDMPSADVTEPRSVDPSSSDSVGTEITGLDDDRYHARTKLGNYRPYRHRKGPNRAVPPGAKGAGPMREPDAATPRT